MPQDPFEQLSAKEYIIIKGARIHNLKNIDVAIPRNKFVVITGLSGSGKSSLAFDTLYAEGQRRYVESLSSYARQFLGRINKPDVDYIKGISPAIAIEQKVNSRNPRSTVGTTTEIYDYLKLLFARIGKTYSPISGDEVKKHTVRDVITKINSFPKGTKVILIAPLLVKPQYTLEKQLQLLLQQGFTRVKYKDEILKIEDSLHLISEKKLTNATSDFAIFIDRFIADKEDEENENRIADSVQTAFFEGNGECFIEVLNEGKTGKTERYSFSNKFEMDGITFTEPSSHFFSFNNPLGACKTCEGFGSVIGIDADLVIPDKSLSIYEGAIACWKGDTMKEWKEKLIMSADKFDFPIHRPYYELSASEKKVVWTGNKHFQGLNDFFKFLEQQIYKIQYRVMLSRYRGKTSCPDCNGTRLRKDAAYVKINGLSISEIVLMPVKQSVELFRSMKLAKYETEIAKRLLIEITNRLQFLVDVGLGYLTLNRLSNTLSGGESQRINLATSLGSSLVGSMYVLDEPSIGLHPRDTQQLIKVLFSLRNLGNTLIVVEHDEEIMKAADEIIDIGPMAGSHGGELMFQGDWKKIEKESSSLTANYLMGISKIELPERRRKWNDFILIKGARENNLKNIDVKFPLHTITVVTGVSGSGKTSLVKRVLYPTLKKMFGGYNEQSGLYDRIEGSYAKLSGVEMIDQNPIGKSSRSNPVTYVKAYDEIRALFAEQPLAKARGYKPSQFSFNVDGGRCEVCEGEGEVKIEMQFMADLHLQCESCGGKRFKQETLEILYHDKSISDILEMTVDDAIAFFESESRPSLIEKKIIQRMLPLADVGLGYVQLGQSSNTLSGGEAQRIKLASFLTKGNSEENLLFIFDEPTTGLHFHDIKKLLYAFNELVKHGHSLLIIEHNSEVIKCADWVIDLGPEGGEEGGTLLFEGVPEDLVKCKASYTGKYLKDKLV
ncbi:MAG: excinuclease ABC subunit UvrA [Bacteroidetes bacterium]|nr:excinuclease ABC subunit UvrA [Bacteroidota bacterium]MBK9799832.1 excinuclease ABC subunit UvrA [Bacteroidota bacterium]